MLTRLRPRVAVVLLAAAVAAAVVVAPVRLPGGTPVAPDWAGQVALGRAIFFDATLSANGNQACASCHAAVAGWAGPVSAVNAAGAVYEGSVAGRFGNRKPPSAAYAAPSPVFHLAADPEGALFVGGNFGDGRATGERLGSPAAEQALGPFVNPAEQAVTSPAEVVRRICTGPTGPRFRGVWGPDLCAPASVAEAYDAVGLSVAAFVGSREADAYSSKFDFVRRGAAAFTAQERLGLALFRDKAKCAECHTLDEGPEGAPLFTDFTYDNLGIPRNPANPWYRMPAAVNPVGAKWSDPGLGDSWRPGRSTAPSRERTPASTRSPRCATWIGVPIPAS